MRPQVPGTGRLAEAAPARRSSTDSVQSNGSGERLSASVDYYEQRMTSSEALAEMEEAEAAERELEEVPAQALDLR